MKKLLFVPVIFLVSLNELRKLVWKNAAEIEEEKEEEYWANFSSSPKKEA